MLFCVSSSPAAAVFDFYGEVSITNSDGVISSAKHATPGNVTAVSIDGIGGIRIPTAGGHLLLESRGPQGASLEIPSEREWILNEGTLEVATDFPVRIVFGTLEVKLTGRAFLCAEGGRSSVSVYAGTALARKGRGGWNIKAFEALTFNEEDGKDPQVVKLLPPALLAAPPRHVPLPHTLNVELSEERSLAGAVVVECALNRTFWANATRHLFRPGEPVTLTDPCPGAEDSEPVYVRVRTANRDGLDGPPSSIFEMYAHRASAAPYFLEPDPAEDGFFLSGPIQGRINVPADGTVVRFLGVRTVTDTEGRFVIRPDVPFGLWVDRLRLNLAGLERDLPLAYLSDPDGLGRRMRAEPGRPAAVYLRSTFIPLRNRAPDIRIFLDGSPLQESETDVALPPGMQREIRVELEDADRAAPAILIQNDTEGPRILNVGLDIRGRANLFYVSADVVDRGVGLELPGRAIFENDVGERTEIQLQKTSDLRLEGRVAAQDLENLRARRSRVWWVRVEVKDLLGNASTFEKSVSQKRDKKFLSLGIKDLVQIWKNKI